MQFHFGKLLSTMIVSFFFLISHKILQCNIVQSKHHFLVYMVIYYLETCIISMRLLAVFRLTFPMLPNIEHAFRFSSTFPLESYTQLFSQKPAVTRDLLDVQTSTGCCLKDNELQNTCTLSEFR